MNRVLQVGEGTGRLEWKEIPRLDPGPREVLVKVQYGVIKHGTEFSMARGYPSWRGAWNEELRIHEKVPGDIKEEGGESFFLAGNMVAGRVAAIGSGVTDFSAGERVFGFSSFAEHVLVPADRLWHLPKIDWRSALCLDPARFALAAVRDSQVRLGDRVAVFGMGAIGLLCVRMALFSGAAQVVAVDPLKERLAAALRLGAAGVLDPSTSDVGRELKLCTGGMGVDAVLEMSGSRQALQEALRGVAFGGKVVCGAFPPPWGGGLDLGAEAHMNCPQILFSRATSDPNREHPRWRAERIEAECLHLTGRGLIPGHHIIDRLVPYAELREEYRMCMENPARAIKLGVVFPAAESGTEGEQDE
ncbi:zinc-binding dehydrogenase [Marispirochaeta aestuarii]|uniref:zinc-binding dehydrogenase n=1 Tax=Marispirochaeta aestuarii TaxID=1963862 RepID=UPI0029C8D42B|nr:zinc-binding dehydrogenase [Marispirochaeta aestuarii]